MRRTLGVRDVMAIAASSTAATTSIGIGIGALAAYAGLQTPALLIVAFLPIFGISMSYARLNRTVWPGFLTGWVVLVANVVFMAYTSAVTGSVILRNISSRRCASEAHAPRLCLSGPRATVSATSAATSSKSSSPVREAPPMTSTSATFMPSTPHLPAPRPRDRHDRPPWAASGSPTPSAPPARETCRAHIAVPADARRIRDIRHFTSAVLSRWGIGGDNLDACVLIVSELAGNAARHGRADLAVLLSLSAHTLHIEVADHGVAVERPAGSAPPDATEHGRGLDIVQALADRYEARQRRDGWRTRVCIRVAPHLPVEASLPQVREHASTRLRLRRSS
ncbi:ATP-binding protein [Streptomyces olivochromogenes]|nr:ATP-binding protein [Streptomyces olivochromogenes]